MQTYIMSKEVFIKEMKKSIGKNEFIVFSNIIQGRISGATKKNLKSIQIGFASDCFKKPDTISDLMNSSCFGLIFLDKKYIPKETIKKIVEGEKR